MATRKKEAIYITAAWFLTLLLTLHPIFTSTLYIHSEYMLCFAAVASVWAVMMGVLYKIGCPSSALFASSLMGILSMGSVTAIPLLQYTSDSSVEDVIASANHIALMSSCVALVIPAIWAILGFAEKMRKQNSAWIPMMSSGLCFLLGGATFLFSDTSSGTAIVFGIMITLPTLIASLASTSCFLNAESRLQRFLCLSSMIFAMLSLVIRNETGVPILWYVTCCVYYMFFHPGRKNKLLILALIFTPVLGFITLWFLTEYCGTFTEHEMV